MLTYDSDLDLIVADSLEEDNTEFLDYAGLFRSSSCITPGNPYILHCFPAHATALTAEHQEHLDAITNKIAISFHDGRPIKRIKIVGHAATWRKISRSEYGRRARTRAQRTKTELLKRLKAVGLGGKVKFDVSHQYDDEALPGHPNLVHRIDSVARNNRARNRRVEIFLNTGGGTLKPGKKNPKKMSDEDKRTLAKKLLKASSNIRKRGAKTIRDRRMLCIISLLTDALVDGEKIDDCFVDTYPPFGRLRCNKSVIRRLFLYYLNSSQSTFEKGLYRIYDQIRKPLEKTKLELIKIAIDTSQVAVLNTPECTFVRFFQKKARNPRSIYYCFREYINVSYGKRCNLE